jgi:PhnB protein
MEVRPGGVWDFIMHGPDGTDYKNKSVYKEVIKPEKLVYDHVSGPKFQTTVTFTEQGKKTLISIQMLFETPEERDNVVTVFKADEGLRQNVEKLNNYVQSQFQIRKELKTTSMARVSTYLNFPGNTEEAFNFYKKIFRTEFSGKGIRRFADTPQPENHPPLSETDKKLILHVELPILGGHIIMATDSPQSMGFTLSRGDNMHINLEPDSRKETKRLFDALSEGGNTTMPLQDMFFGAYFGTCTDKFGINWMFNYTEKNNMEENKIVLERIYNAPLPTVWKALTDINQMKQWYFPQLESFEPKEGFETQFNVHHEGKDYYHIWKIKEVVPMKKISVEWKYKDYPGNSLVSFELFTQGNKTRLVLTHEGIETFSPEKYPELAKKNFVEGWTQFMDKELKEFLEKQ